MTTLQVLMPMGGLGSRFANAGFTLPKPLIPVDKMPMFIKAITSLDKVKLDKEFFFVIRKEHADEQSLDKLIRQALPEAKVIIITELTKGAVETALKAKDYLNENNALIVMDCDLWFSSEGYERLIAEGIKDSVNLSGGLLTFASNNPRYSYAVVDENGYVQKTAEKEVISNNAITGAYFFSQAKSFIDAAGTLINRPISSEMPEYYLSLLYNILLENGKNIKAAQVDEFASFGTPEELQNYKDSMNE
jgi:dTDP-glucose pyrophosphorylase